MNHKEIEILKHTLTNLVKQGCRLKIPAFGVEGRVVGTGFKPYWTSPYDSRLEKLEFDITDGSGRTLPFNFHYITGYDVIAQDDRNLAHSKNISLDIHVYAPGKAREKEPIDKIRVVINTELNT